MRARDFCFWLQGFFELSGSGQPLSANQADMVQRHLALVFKHEIDPQMGDDATQVALTALHAESLFHPHGQVPVELTPDLTPFKPGLPFKQQSGPDGVLVRC